MERLIEKVNSYTRFRTKSKRDIYERQCMMSVGVQRWVKIRRLSSVRPLYLCNGSRPLPPSARPVAIVSMIPLKFGGLSSQNGTVVASFLAMIYGTMRGLLLLWRASLTHPNDVGRFEAMLDDDLNSYESYCLLKVLSHSRHISPFP